MVCSKKSEEDVRVSENNILFVSDKETFIVQSIMKKLEVEGVKCGFITLDMKSLVQIKAEMGAPVCFYIGDNVDYDTESLIYFRDLCTDNDCRVFLIGYEDAIADLKEKVFGEQVAGEFHRPVNVGQFVPEMLKEVDKEAALVNRKHILVVDDSGTMLSTIKGWLQDKYRVTPVNSALNAITFLTKQKPNLILLDYEMPACSGKQFLEMIRSDVESADIPVIFLTGRDDSESVKSVLALKPAGYLLKSLPKEKIIAEVDDFFAKNETE